MKSNEIAINVQNVSKTFRLPHEKQNSIKGAFLNTFKKKSYEQQEALKDINFEIKKGEFFGIVGRNGSGKSTLLKCMAGVYTPTKGKIHVNGTLVPFIELGVGFNPELSGRDNVFLNGALLGFSREQMDEMYEDIVNFAELEQFMDQKLKNYSSGMQVRLAFSIAIRARGDILLLDEVLAVGDEAFQRKCNLYFEEIKESGATVVLVTHNMTAVERYCDRAILIDSGKSVLQGEPQEIADEYRNMNMSVNDTGKPKIVAKNDTLKIQVVSQTDNTLKFSMTHQESDKGDYYFGFSLIKDGMTFAELSNRGSTKHKIRDKKLTYVLDTTNLNPGVYEISATLFRTRAMEPVAYTKTRPQFMIKGQDQIRGAALTLAETWE